MKVGEVMRQGGLVVTAYSADHAPPHVHVFRHGQYEVVLLLDNLVTIREIRGDAISKAVRAARRLVAAHLHGCRDLTEHEILEARQRGTTTMAIEPRAVEAWYDREHDVISVRLDNGRMVAVPRADFQELAGARPELLQQVEILGPGSAVHFPNAGAGFTVASLVREQYGSPRWMARIAGRTVHDLPAKRSPKPFGGMAAREHRLGRDRSWRRLSVEAGESRRATSSFCPAHRPAS
jgi:hypothetical protein